MYKIDFFPGCHGHFLELVINTFTANQHFLLDGPVFDSNGACHLYRPENYKPSILCNHFSLLGHTIDSADRIIEIHVPQDQLLIATINFFLRSGANTTDAVDIYNLDVDTFEKLSNNSKTQYWLDNLIKLHGKHSTYSKSILRMEFYQRFTNMFYTKRHHNAFQRKGEKYTFPFTAFFDFDQFLLHVKQSSNFLGLEFVPNDQFQTLWKDFVSHNQGYQSQLRCDQIVQSLSTNQPSDLNGLSIIEEAWIAYKLNQPGWLTQFPTDTKTINPA